MIAQPLPVGLPAQQMGLCSPDMRLEDCLGELKELPEKPTLKYDWTNKDHLKFEENPHHCKVREQDKRTEKNKSF